MMMTTKQRRTKEGLFIIQEDSEALAAIRYLTRALIERVDETNRALERMEKRLDRIWALKEKQMKEGS